MIAQLPQADDASFDQAVLSEPSPVMIEFYSQMCGHCRRMAPVIETLARDYGARLRIFQVDANRNPALLERFGIRGVPTMVLLVGGKETDRMVGAMPREALEAHVDRVLAEVPHGS